MSLKKISIVGAGPVGCLLSLQLCKRGYAVDLFERRPDIRLSKIHAGRSINLALSLRGIHALSTIGIERQVLQNAIPMLGRMMHDPRGECTFQRYGMSDDQYINSISRGALNSALLDAVDAQENCKIHFERRLTRYSFADKTMHFTNDRSGQLYSQTTECVIGSDGSASALRESMAQQCGLKCREDLLDYGYKELTMPAGDLGSFMMDKNALHIWPRGKFMLIALPNVDGSFTCTLFLPFEGSESFEQFTDTSSGRKNIAEFFQKYFPDAMRLIPDYENAMIHNPLGKMLTVRADRWNYGGQALLIGDAAHAIVPFFGQGLNCSFEDCTLLDTFFDDSDDLNEIFSKFTEARKPDADAIAELAQENFVEMRDKVAQPRFLLEKEIEKKLMKFFPESYVSRYSMVTFSRRPYQHALIAGRAQDKILKQLSEEIKSADDVNKDLAKSLIEKHARELNPS